MNLQLILDVAVTLALEVGRAKMSVRDLLQLAPGAIVILQGPASIVPAKPALPVRRSLADACAVLKVKVSLHRRSSAHIHLRAARPGNQDFATPFDA